MQGRNREQSNPRSPTQNSTSTSYANSAAGNQSPMPYNSMHSTTSNEDWAAHQQQQYNAQLLYQQTQQQHIDLGMHDYSESQSAYNNLYSPQPDYQAHHQDHNALPYQSHVYYGSGTNGSTSYVHHPSSSFSPHQPHYQQLQSPPMSMPPSTRQTNTIKSPRQQFADTLKRGVQNTFTPAGGGGGVTDTKHHESRQSISQVAALPARPDSAIRAAQANQGDMEMNMLQMPFNNTHSGRSGTVAPSMTTAAVAAPPRRAPSLPLASRFSPLPPIPPLTGDATIDEGDLRRKFEAREEAMLLRVDALGFQPESAWQVMQEAIKDQRLDETTETDQDNREVPAPVLGIRLLQRLDLLQKENEELEAIFVKNLRKGDDSELHDARLLIDALDEALSAAIKRADQAEAKVSSLEKALAAACDQRSSAITKSPSGRIQSPTSSPPWQKKSLPSGQSN